LRRLATIALLLTATACGGGNQTATDASSRADAGAATDTSTSSTADAAADRAAVDAATPDGKDASAPAPDAGPADTGPPNLSCPPLQASGNQITDMTTNLVWSRYAHGPATLSDATATCAQSGARLPTESELLAFANTSRAALFTTCDEPIPQPWPTDGEPMWSTTPAPENPNFRFTVYYAGMTTEHPSTDGVPYICVSP
jgi:hypothetical protein